MGSYAILKAFFGFLAAVASIAAAFFKLKESRESSKSQHEVQSWYEEKWVLINNSNFLSLPEIIIKEYLKQIDLLPLYTYSNFDKLKKTRGLPLLTFLIFPISSIGWGLGSLLGWPVGVFLTILLLTLSLFSIYKTQLTTPSFTIPLCFLMSIVFALWLALQLPIIYSFFIIITLSPILIGAGVFAIIVLTGSHLEDYNIMVKLGDPVPKNYIGFKATLFSWSIVFSCLTTVSALLIGNIAYPNTNIPQTMQMVIANIACDSLTVFATISILSSAIGKDRYLPIPFAITLDFTISALLACTSLWAGVAYTNDALSLSEILNILIGKDVTGSTMELSAFFWVMHTTFIPTFIFLGSILICWLGKIIILPLYSVTREGKEVPNPLNYTAAVFAFIAVILAAITACISHIESIFK